MKYQKAKLVQNKPSGCFIFGVIEVRKSKKHYTMSLTKSSIIHIKFNLTNWGHEYFEAVMIVMGNLDCCEIPEDFIRGAILTNSVLILNDLIVFWNMKVIKK